MKSFDERLNIIQAWTIDDIIDNDPIAEAIYEKFLTINAVSYTMGDNVSIVDYMKVARILIISAFDDKHPEFHMTDKYDKIIDNGFPHSPTCALHIMEIVYVSLQLCLSLPKNMERFMDCIHHKLSYYHNNSTYEYTFEHLITTLKEENYFYTIDALVNLTPIVTDITKMDWETITNGYEQSDIEAQVLGIAEYSPEQMLDVLEAIEARYNMSGIHGEISKEKDEMKNFFANLRKIVMLRIKNNSPAVPAINENDEINRLREEKATLENEITHLRKNQAELQTMLTEVKEREAVQASRFVQMKAALEEKEQGKVDAQDSEDAKEDDPGTRTRKVTSAALYEIIKIAMDNLGEKQHTYIDLAKLISYFTNYSFNKIRNEISYGYTFNNRQAKEIEKVNELLKNVGINVKLKYDNE